MALQCPACATKIRKKANEAVPMPGVVYRCPVCRLELLLDGSGLAMTVAPLPRIAADRPTRKRRAR